MKKILVKKGHTLKIESCENDLDNVNTKYYTVTDIAEAKAIKHTK